MVKNTHIISMLTINNLRVSNYRAFREYRCHNNHLTNQLINHLTRSVITELLSICQVENLYSSFKVIRLAQGPVFSPCMLPTVDRGQFSIDELCERRSQGGTGFYGVQHLSRVPNGVKIEDSLGRRWRVIRIPFFWEEA